MAAGFKRHIRETAFDSIKGLNEVGYAFLLQEIMRDASGVFAFGKDGKVYMIVIAGLSVNRYNGEISLVVKAMKSFLRIPPEGWKKFVGEIMYLAETLHANCVRTEFLNERHARFFERFGAKACKSWRLDV